MFKHCLYMEVIRSVGKWGNSAGVLLPREMIGSQVKIIVIDRTLEIKKEVLNILEPYLDDIIGVYLTGSYARGEQEENSDIDIFAVSKELNKEINSGKYNISISPLVSIKKTADKHPELIFPRINEAKTIINSSLLEDLRGLKVGKEDFKEFVRDTKEAVKMNEEQIEIDKLQEKKYASASCVYSSILRLRGVYLVKKLLEKESYKKREFVKWIEKGVGEEFEEAYEVYRSVRDKKKTSRKVSMELGEKLNMFLKDKIKEIEK